MSGNNANQLVTQPKKPPTHTIEKKYIKAAQHLKNREVEEAQLQYLEIIRHNKYSANAYLNLARIYYATAKYRQAESYYRRYLQNGYYVGFVQDSNLRGIGMQQPIPTMKSDALVYYQLGRVYIKINMHEQAQNQLIRAVNEYHPKLVQEGRLSENEVGKLGLQMTNEKIKHNLGKALYQLGVINYNNKKYEFALEYLSNSLKLNIQHYPTCKALGILHHTLANRDQDSCIEYQNEGKPTRKIHNQLSNHNLGQKQRRQVKQISRNHDRHKTALQFFHLAQKLQINNRKKDFDLFEKVACLYSQIQQNQKAKMYFQRAIQINKEAVKAYFNMGVILEKQGNYSQSLQYIKRAEGIQPNNPLYIMSRAIVEYKAKAAKMGTPDSINNKSQVQLMRKVQDIINSPHIQQIKTKHELSQQVIKWVSMCIKQFSKIQQFYEQEQEQVISTNSLLNSSRMKITKVYFQQLGKFPRKNKQTKRHQMQSNVIDILTNQIHILNQQINKLKVNMKQIQKNVETLKKQFEWDHKFESLLNEKPQRALYFKYLFSIITGSVGSYRYVNIGVVGTGTVLTSNVGDFIRKINSILGIAHNMPVVSSFCTHFVKLGEFYLEEQKDEVIKHIVSSLDSIYSQKQLTKATFQAILYLGYSSIFQYLAKIQQKDKQNNKVLLWFDYMFNKVQNIKKKVTKFAIKNMSSFDTHQTPQEMDIAMKHCSMILLIMIKRQNRIEIAKAKNPLLRAAQLWVQAQKNRYQQIISEQQKQKQRENKQKQNIIIFKIMRINMNQTKMRQSNLYFKVSCGQQTHIISVKRGNHDQNLQWLIFRPDMEKSQKIIHFRYYIKNYILKDELIGQGQLSVGLQKLRTTENIQLFHKGVKMGVLDVSFYI